MYLKRLVDSDLVQWKNKQNHKPLIVKGPRQVGKTESIMHFAKANYKNVVYINFVEEPAFKNICANGYSVDVIVRNVTLIDPSIQFIDKETLIIFDELQDYPGIATALKFFHIDGRYDVICSGSMLGINYQKIESNSVGYKEDYVMYSLSFKEFLWAKKYSDAQINEILEHMITLTPFALLEMNVFEELFLDYCVLGGMPAVVSEYIATNTFSNSLMIQRQLIADYKEDIRKYASGLDQTRILNVFNHIPVQLAKDNKKFQISKVAHGANFRDYRGCIEWLIDAGMVNACYCLNYPELPLKGNYDELNYKLYFADTGLLVAMLDDEAQMDLRANKNLGVYKGALFENIVSEAMVKSGYSLYFYKKSNSTLEQDFFVRTMQHLIPIEVKATNGSAKSLRTLIESDAYEKITFGIKFASTNIGYSNNIYTFPLFCAFLLKDYLTKQYLGNNQ